MAPQENCTNPADVPWLSTDPISGTTAAGQATDVDVTFDSTGLAAGTYNANLCITSNDPGTEDGFGGSAVVVPVSLTVPSLPAPAIVLTKTVGTTPGVCAATDEITVPAGTEVYYCYQVENTGDVAFNFHDLEDSELGVILDNFPYTLSPGAFSPQVIVPETINITTTNCATWTAFTSLSGYVYDDGAPFDYSSIATFGTPLGLADDGEANVTMPFPFTYFGVTSSDLRVGNNGGILFNATTRRRRQSPTQRCPTQLTRWRSSPSGTTSTATPANVYYATVGTAPNRQFIVEWFDRPHFSNVGSATFQVVLYEGTNQIKFLYADVNFGNASYDFGASATVGLNKDGTTALQYSFNQPVITDQMAILWTPVQALSASDSACAMVNVQYPQIDVDPLNFDVKVGLGQATTRTLTIANVGDAPLDWVIDEEDTTAAATTPTVPNANPAAALDVVQPGDGTKLADSAPAPLSTWRTPEAVLWDNGPLVTNPGGGAGGADASALQTALGLSTYGFGHAVSSGFRVADDFTVPAGGWLVSDITFFAYQTGSTTTSTINNVNLRIWDGPPGQGGSNVVFGDTATNRLASSAWSNIYRVLDTGLLDTARPVMADVATVNTFLPAGTYWVDWQTGGTLASGPWAPPVSIVGQTAKPGLERPTVRPDGWDMEPAAGHRRCPGSAGPAVHHPGNAGRWNRLSGTVGHQLADRDARQRDDCRRRQYAGTVGLRLDRPAGRYLHRQPVHHQQRSRRRPRQRNRSGDRAHHAGSQPADRGGADRPGNRELRSACHRGYGRDQCLPGGCVGCGVCNHSPAAAEPLAYLSGLAVLAHSAPLRGAAQRTASPSFPTTKQLHSMTRQAGVLLHPTSFPCRYGIGDLGEAAYQFVDFLHGAGQSIWQVLPLGPTGYGDSPYQCFSAFAGNPLLIDLDQLVGDGLLSWDDLNHDLPDFPRDKVDYGPVINWKFPLLQRSFQRFRDGASPELEVDYHIFCAENAAWLDDYALFMAIKEAQGGGSWGGWELDIRTRQPAALKRWIDQTTVQVRMQKYLQWQFFRQWQQLKQYASARGISILGDIPIFVAYDSADAWANRELFFIDEAGQPEMVAGVPPDYFSATGQLWGNPLYRWDKMAAQGFVWWIARFRAMLTMVDIIRVDHFRAFYDYWEIPAGEETAIKGRWMMGPGPDLFRAVEAALGKVLIVAEDLGDFSPATRAGVDALMSEFSFPGMKILQFGFGSGPNDQFLPHNYTSPGWVVYPGTHDNDTIMGWYAESSQPYEREYALKYLGKSDASDLAWDIIRLGWASVADTAVTAVQDLLSLDSAARMNVPSRPGGNWQWRYQHGDLDDKLQSRLLEMTRIYGRLPERETDEAAAAT